MSSSTNRYERWAENGRFGTLNLSAKMFLHFVQLNKQTRKKQLQKNCSVDQVCRIRSVWRKKFRTERRKMRWSWIWCAMQVLSFFWLAIPPSYVCFGRPTIKLLGPRGIRMILIEWLAVLPVARFVLKSSLFVCRILENEYYTLVHVYYFPRLPFWALLVPLLVLRRMLLDPRDFRLCSVEFMDTNQRPVSFPAKTFPLFLNVFFRLILGNWNNLCIIWL